MDLISAMVDFRSRQPRAANRQEAIQLYCCAELKKRGIPNPQIETEMAGAYRKKAWDVGVVVDGEPRLGISCKSIVSNHGGTVPNRVDDMLGEAVSLHRAFPNAVLGYLFMMSRRDESVAATKKTEKLGGLTPARLQQLHKEGDFWFHRLVTSVTKASNRSGPKDVPEKFEAVSCSQIDFDLNPYGVIIHQGAYSPDDFFDRLVEIYEERFG